jgi:nucleoside-diphosphate-sugar epimerase
MQALVTGATGFAGRSVTMTLLGAGHIVHGLVRDLASTEGLRQAGMSLHAGDRREPRTYVPPVGQVDAVVQAAQLPTAGRVTAAKARAVFAAEHIMASALAQACLDQHKRPVHTGGCPGGEHGDELITEHMPLSPSPMGQGHVREAAALQRLHDQHGPAGGRGARPIARPAPASRRRKPRATSPGSVTSPRRSTGSGEQGLARALAPAGTSRRRKRHARKCQAERRTGQ